MEIKSFSDLEEKLNIQTNKINEFLEYCDDSFLLPTVLFHNQEIKFVFYNIDGLGNVDGNRYIIEFFKDGTVEFCININGNFYNKTFMPHQKISSEYYYMLDYFKK